ncbi:L,D-transpeptidase family protein [Clostridium oryzae]|uniref:L,D-TPase catalytic domain-containing protein n=1 Tax=Clostridium oryzae TaxID=1450648 RepID=A0A1V4ICI2_9CLOT|nr:L,D-transpeptidase family protein [Clostridium oryzae]OPJ57643.1 hypothetical protein CLORY_40100 [Clostridium oryzae]
MVQGDDVTDRKKKKYNKIIISSILFFCVLLGIYLGTSIYFSNHFYFNSSIDSIDVSCKTVTEAQKQIQLQCKSYTIKLNERGGKTEQIKGYDIGLRHLSNKEIYNLKRKQKPYKWFIALISSKICKMTEKISYNKRLLKKQINRLSCLRSGHIIEPKNPTFKYINGEYKVINGTEGNKVNKNLLYDNVAKAIISGKNILNLEATNCYVQPQYDSHSQKIKDTKRTLDKYVSSKITYILGKDRKIINGVIINKWIKIDEDLNVTFDETKARSYLNSIFSAYNTVGTTRNFVTTSGRTVKVSGGDYGWSINSQREAETAIANIKKGETLTKQPQYAQKALSKGSNDIGNTYVEINIPEQHLWFYKNGSLIAQGDVVTGNVSENHSTPAGVYSVKYKQRNAILKGQGYSSPVSFWMPFNGGIGMHDANWRRVFGGSIYKIKGSHGCVNCPYNLAKKIFYNIDAGTPVICYY